MQVCHTKTCKDGLTCKQLYYLAYIIDYCIHVLETSGTARKRQSSKQQHLRESMCKDSMMGTFAPSQ